MPAKNQWVGEGHAVKDAELSQTRNGKPVCRITIGISNGEGQTEKSTFVPIAIYGVMAELAAREIKKGDAVHVEGKLDLQSWKDTQTSEWKNKTEIVAFSFWHRPKGSGPKKAEVKAEPKQDPVEAMKVPEVLDLDTIPF